MTFPARDRQLWVGRRDKVFPARAAKFGFRRELYDVPSSGLWLPPDAADPGSVDPFINGYEPGVTEVLDGLDAGGWMNLQLWLRTAVPFVTSMFVRGADFAARFESRPVIQAAQIARVDPGSTNRARLMELNRLLPLVVGARWVVLHQVGAEPFIINDLGLMPTIDLGRDASGFAIPISKSSVLGIFPQQHRTVATYRDGGWRAVIEHRFLDANEVEGFNREMTRCATEWIAGANQSVIDKNIAHFSDAPPDPRLIMESWPFDHQTRVAHVRDWHRLISATAANAPPDQLPDLQQVDYDQLGNGWCPPLVVTMNMTEMPTGLSRVGNTIRLSLDKPANYERHFIRREDEQAHNKP
jgi:hypothetical protein